MWFFMDHILSFKNMSKFSKMLLFGNILKTFKKSPLSVDFWNFLNAPIYEHFLNLIFGQKSKKKKKQYFWWFYNPKLCYCFHFLWRCICFFFLVVRKKNCHLYPSFLAYWLFLDFLVWTNHQLPRPLHFLLPKTKQKKNDL